MDNIEKESTGCLNKHHTFCKKCDNAILEDANFCPACGTLVARDSGNIPIVFCWQCGAEVPAAADYCENCGTEQRRKQKLITGTGAIKYTVVSFSLLCILLSFIPWVEVNFFGENSYNLFRLFVWLGNFEGQVAEALKAITGLTILFYCIYVCLLLAVIVFIFTDALKAQYTAIAAALTGVVTVAIMVLLVVSINDGALGRIGLTQFNAAPFIMVAFSIVNAKLVKVLWSRLR